MPLATALCPISGRSVVLMTLLVVVAEDEVGDAARLGLALDLVGEPVHRLRTLVRAVAERPDLGHLHVHADALVNPQRRRETDLVQAVVEYDAEPVDGADLPQQAGGQS